MTNVPPRSNPAREPMEQIAKTVNSFVAFIVGIGLICFASFVFLLASARLSNSTLGTLLARSAGETARMARTESLAFWGQVGSEVSAGLGVAQTIPSGGVSANFTPVVPAATAPAPVSTTPQPPATPTPTNYTRSSPFSEGALLIWRGLDANSKPIPTGVDWNTLKQQVNFALLQNPGDLLALWLRGKVDACQPLYDRLVNDDYQNAAQRDAVYAAANTLLTQCNPRLFLAYGYQRYADLWKWSNPPVDETQAARLLDGLQISIGDKVSGPARAIRPEDSVVVTVQAIPQYGLAGFNFSLTVGTVNQLLGEDKWGLNSGPYTVGAGSLFPANPAEPPLPGESDLTPPAVTQSQAVAAPAAGSCSGKYVVQNGDTVYSIARQCGVDVGALVAANPDTLGVNPNFIVPGQELNIPAP